jgi:ADP-heptose:LPS heptosyltransferase
MNSIIDLCPEKILVLRALQLGDMLCSVPALRALRAAFPKAQISLAGLPWAKSFVWRFRNYIDHFIEFPGYPGLVEREPALKAIPRFLQAMRREQFDLAIQLHGSGVITNPLLITFGAKHAAGFYRRDNYCPDPETFFLYPEDIPEIKRCLRLMQYLKIKTSGDHLEFPLYEEDQNELSSIPDYAKLDGQQYICIHPGARSAARRWSPEQFAAVANMLTSNGYKIVITGSQEENDLAKQIMHLMQVPAYNFARAISAGALAALISKAALLICNDTGVSHIAAALRIPSVVIFLASDINRWAPLDPVLHKALYTPKIYDVVNEARMLLRVSDRQEFVTTGHNYV